MPLAGKAVSFVEEWRGPDADEHGRGAKAVIEQPEGVASAADSVFAAIGMNLSH